MLLNSLRIPDIAFYFDPLPKAPKTPEDADNSLKLMHILGFNKAKHAELARCYNAMATGKPTG